MRNNSIDKKIVKFRSGNVVVALGIFHLLFLSVLIYKKIVAFLFFLSAGWAEIIKLVISFFKGDLINKSLSVNNSYLAITVFGVEYALFHIIVISFFLFSLRNSGVVVCFFGILSIIFLVIFTVTGLNFSWT